MRMRDDNDKLRCFAVFGAIAALLLPLVAAPVEVASPDGRIVCDVYVDAGGAPIGRFGSDQDNALKRNRLVFDSDRKMVLVTSSCASSPVAAPFV